MQHPTSDKTANGWGEAGAGEGTFVHRSHSLAGDVYEAIFQQLMSLKISPGSRITVDALVKEFNVSHTPIREALGRLEGEGLVEKRHLVGYRAAPQITRRRFDELYELRLLLEPSGAAKAASAMDEAKLLQLQEAAGVMARSEGRDERLRYSTFARQDAIFHDRIMEFAGNELIRQTLTFQHTHFHIFRLMFHSRVTEEALNEHDDLLAAFAAGDSAAAEEAMRVHIECSRDRLLLAFD
ncbi:MAG: GntR family transcriptional regulator [Rhizobiales bacterium]|nr:GntR family transcriptional regulator [Hyphomicrobiales bacterium]MBA70397.1 GntR family transcriptional regulator [Hyphomicrobiales bacterium]|tara:strand:- start:54 stop:770 length:717 start_codon:yes stop_codon:yes gene_type:complete